jgi:hypothetical protein
VAKEADEQQRHVVDERGIDNPEPRAKRVFRQAAEESIDVGWIAWGEHGTASLRGHASC